MSAASHKHSECTKWALCQAGLTPFHILAGGGADKEALQLFVSNWGNCVNCATSDVSLPTPCDVASFDTDFLQYNTPLHLACKGNHVATVLALIELGANVRQTTRVSITRSWVSMFELSLLFSTSTTVFTLQHTTEAQM